MEYEPVSVVMPAYNAQEFISVAITSTLAALGPLDELLVLDDGSSDSTASKIRAVSDSRLRVISNSSNEGVSASLNLLIAHARHQIIARMDADDICLPWRFRRQRSLLDRNPTTDFLFSNVMIRLDSPKLPSIVMPYYMSSATHAQLARLSTLTNPFIHPTAIMRRRAIEELGGYNNVPNEDFDLWMRAFMGAKKLYRDGIPAIVFRVHPSQLTRSEGWKAENASNGMRAPTGLLHEISGGARLGLLMRYLEVPKLF